MAPRKTTSRPRARSRASLIQGVTTPLGFFVLSLIIVEGTLAIVLSASNLSEEHVWDGFCWMVALFAAVIVIVTVLVFWKPEKLLYGKEEHSNPALEPSALADAIEGMIRSSVKPDCLKNPHT